MHSSVVGIEPAKSLETISFGDKLAVIFDVLLPTVAKGVLLRRPSVLALADRFDVDRRAVRRLQKIRAKYGNGPLLVRVLARQHALVLSSDDMARVLADAPVPFTPASDEKKAALAHFEPHVSLISKGIDRVERRRFNDQALESTCPNHAFAERFARIAEEEGKALLGYAGDHITWDEFSPAWDRIVRRIVLGDAARDDTRLTELLTKLRGSGNWSFVVPRNKRRFDAYMKRLERHIARAEPGSLAAALAQTPKSSSTAPCSQATHWIFAFDAGGIAAFSALALLGTHADLQARGVAEAQGRGAPATTPKPTMFPFLRACLLDSLRLWPTTMIVHRQSTEETTWNTAVMPAGTSVLIFAPFFHRDDQRLEAANKFKPDIWIDEPGKTKLPFIPFSAGPGECPGRHIVLLAGAALLASILRARDVRLPSDRRLSPAGDLPGTLDHFALEIDISRPRASPEPAVQTAPSA